MKTTKRERQRGKKEERGKEGVKGICSSDSSRVQEERQRLEGGGGRDGYACGCRGRGKALARGLRSLRALAIALEQRGGGGRERAVLCVAVGCLSAERQAFLAILFFFFFFFFFPGRGRCAVALHGLQ